jgi:hypothetical protein
MWMMGLTTSSSVLTSSSVDCLNGATSWFFSPSPLGGCNHLASSRAYFVDRKFFVLDLFNQSPTVFGKEIFFVYRA